ncbi:MAG: hypothetical protein HPY71_14305 [Firmicutes bacterium]|nr:hypothetical protein [Bacillota bacterium]
MRRWIFAGLILLVILAWTFTVCAEEPGPADGTITVDPIGTVQAAQPDYKAMYFDVLDRYQALEDKLQQAIDLARGYRTDWEDQRRIAETRKEQLDNVLKLTDTLMGLIADMKDTVAKQHEIILRLTDRKGGLIIGATAQPTGDGAIRPGILAAVEVPLW